MIYCRNMPIPEDLQSIIHGEVATDPASLEAASKDASIFTVRPAVVVHPMNTEDIKNLVTYASSREGVSLTVRSAGTDMTGGPLSESVIVDMGSHFTRMGNVHGDTIAVEPGVLYRNMEKETLKAGMILPSYPASRELCSVGGMVNNNSGGEKTLYYGKTEKYVNELHVVLADGNEYAIKPLAKHELMKAMEEPTFLGKAYKAVYELIEKNYDEIQKAKPHVSKNSAGYSLWNVWNRKTFDLTQLFVGSQGTLGITTNITFRLVHPKKHASLLVLFLPSLIDVAEITKCLLSYQPESLESYDNRTMALAIKLFPDFMKKMKTNAFSLALKFLPEVSMIIRGGLPKLIILAQFTGDDPEEILARAQSAQHAVKHWKVKTRIAANEKEQEKYWTIRRESFNMLRHHIKGKHTAPFIDDFIILPEHLPEFLPQLTDILKSYRVEYTIAGHVGDGNFHIIPLMNLKDQKEQEIIPKLSKEVYKLVFKYHGSSTAEHNDGLIRSYLLPQMYGEHIYGLFEQTKKIFDPKGIFNPGKKVGSDIAWALKHIAY